MVMPNAIWTKIHFMTGTTFLGGVQGKEALTALPGIELISPEEVGIFSFSPVFHGYLICFCLEDNSFT